MHRDQGTSCIRAPDTPRARVTLSLQRQLVGKSRLVAPAAQTWLQGLPEEEVDELLGRRRYARREGIDAPVESRNGFGKTRRLTLSVGTITVRRPPVRGLSERFESRLLPLFKRRTETVGELLPTLYVQGLAEGHFDLALRGLLGDGASLSASSIARLKASWQGEYVVDRGAHNGVVYVDGMRQQATAEAAA